MAENGRVVACWNAGTRKLGNVTTEEEADEATIALPKALPPLAGASILGGCVFEEFGDLPFNFHHAMLSMLQLRRSSKNLDGLGKASDRQGCDLNPNP